MMRGNGLSPRERRDRRTRRNMWVSVGIVVLVVGVIGGMVMIAMGVNPRLDRRLCPIGEPSPREVVIVFDATDPWNEVQRTVIKHEFREIQGSVPRFARVTLYHLEREAGERMPDPAVQLCNPGSLDQLGDVKAAFFANPDSIRARWERGFVGTLDSLIPDRTDAIPRSLIMETVRAGAIDVFGEGEGEGREKHLYVFSDLLQNSAAYTHYEDRVWRQEEARRLADVGALGTRALRGVRVHLFLLDRDVVGVTEGHSRSRLVRFWDAFFSEQGARVQSVRRIEG